MKKVLLSALACGYLVAGINDGLVVHYEFEGNANDSSGNGNNGTEYGGVEYVDGVMGKAVKLDENTYIDADAILNKDTSFSLSVWANISEDINEKSKHTIVFERDSKGHDLCGNYSSGNYGLTIYEGKFAFETSTYENNICSQTRTFIEENILKDKFYFITSIYDKVTKTQKIYINGNLMVTDNVGDSLRTYNGATFRIGRNTTAYPWLGLIDDLRIYDRALSEDEIKELYYLKNCECNTQTDTTCDSSKIYTQSELDEAVLNAKNGMFAQSDLDEKYQEGKDYCKSNPEICGIPTTSTTPTDTTSNIDSKNVKMELRAGWNLVSIPGYTPYAIDKLFAPEEEMAIVSNIKSVFAFDVEQGGWLSYVPGNRDNSLINLYPGQGFWVNNKYNMSYEFNGEVQTENLTYKGDGLGSVEVPPGVGN